MVREERYVVLKIKHLDSDAKVALRDFLAAHRIEPVEAVVVERDWPEYEPVWKMIENRVDGSKLL